MGGFSRLGRHRFSLTGLVCLALLLLLTGALARLLIALGGTLCRLGARRFCQSGRYRHWHWVIALTLGNIGQAPGSALAALCLVEHRFLLA